MIAMASTYWEHFPHPADMGIRGVGPSMESAFEQAALAMTAVTIDPAVITPCQVVEIQREEKDIELLYLAWLNDLLFEMDTRRMVFGRFKVHIKAGRLTATAWGEGIDRHRQELLVEVKAATYAELEVRQREDGLWVAQCIVDV
jgi:SHS2 domain-containing protein